MDNIQPDKLDEQLNEGLDFQYDSCYFCNCFYGPNFGEPICATCHDFLYSEDFELIDVLHRPVLPGNSAEISVNSISFEKDDGDSGNDEPSEEAGVSVRALRVYRVLPPAPNEGEGGGGGEDGNLNDIDMGNPEDPMRAPSPVELVVYESTRESVGRQVQPEMNEKMVRRLALLTTPSNSPQGAAASNVEDAFVNLPPEIWAIIFGKLDDTSVLMVSKVCTKWRTIIAAQFPDSFWEQYVKERWPLLRPIYNVESWYSICSDLIDSLPCKSCYLDMRTLPLPVIDMNERTLRQSRLSREIKWLRVDHPEGIEATPLDNLNYNWLARVNGPPDSPYQGGVFYLNLKIHSDYPLKPPVVRFLTRIFHPNVSRHGDIGIDCIQHNWTLALTISQILLSVQSLLTDPYTEASMEPNVASLYQNQRKTFDKIARIWTWKYAMHDVLVH